MTKITRVTIRETDVEYRGRTQNVYVSYEAIYELGLKLASRAAAAAASKRK